MENDTTSLDYDNELRKFREMMLVKRRLSCISNHNCCHHHNHYNHRSHNYHFNNHHTSMLRHQNSLLSRSSNDDNDTSSYPGSNILVDDFDDEPHGSDENGRKKNASPKDEKPFPQRPRKGSQSWKNVRAVMAYYYALRKIKRNGANNNFV